MEVNKQKLYALIIALLVIVAIGVRIWHLGSYPAGINQDEAMSAVDARAIAAYGTDRYGNPHPVFFEGWKIGQQSAFSIYLLSAFLKFLPFNEFSTRLPQLLLSLVGLAAACWIVRMLFGKTAALFTLGLLAIDPWHIMQSRWLLDCNSLPHVFILAFALLVHSLRNDRLWECYLSFVLFGLALYTYGVALFAVCFFVAIVLILFLVRKRFSFWRIFSFGCSWLCIAAPLLAMTVINQFGLPSIQNSLFSIQYFSESIRVNDILFFSDNIMRQLSVNLRSLFETLVLQQDSEITNSLPWIGGHYLIYLIFCLIGITVFLCDKSEQAESDRLTRSLLLAFIITGLTTGLVVAEVNISRINIIHYALIIFCALGLAWLWQQRRPLAYFSIACYVVCFAFFSFGYFRTYKHAMNDLYFNGYKEAIRYADTFPGEICVANSMFEHNYFMVSEILTQYYLPVSAEYYQGITNEYTNLNGELMRLPYAQRFQFVDYLQDHFTEYPGCVIVSYNQFADYYREAGYTIHEFPNYIVGIKQAQFTEAEHAE